MQEYAKHSFIIIFDFIDSKNAEKWKTQKVHHKFLDYILQEAI